MNTPYQLLPGGSLPRRGPPRRTWIACMIIACTCLAVYGIARHTGDPADAAVTIVRASEGNESQVSDPVDDVPLASVALEEEIVAEILPLLEFQEPKPCNELTVTEQKSPAQRWESPSLALPSNASLETRLASWLESPLESYANWTAFNNQTCDNISVRRASNNLHEGNNYDVWATFDAQRVDQIRSELADVLRAAKREGRLDGSLGGPARTRGIVFTAGNADTMARVRVSLRLLRLYGCTLPAEVFHFSEEQTNSDQEHEFESLNATVRVLEHGSKEASLDRSKSFHIKAALAQSSFDEMLYLDSDSIPAKDPTALFDSPGFREYGAMFWPDYWKDSPNNAIWSILGVQCRDEWTMEAGQILLDKRRHMDALLLVEHMLKDWRFWFRLSDGDKDLFRYAFLALRKRWAVPGLPIASASWTNKWALGGDKAEKFCGHTMIQSDLEGPAFVHANLVKRILGAFREGDAWGRSRQLVLQRDSADSSEGAFATGADHLANANEQGIAIAAAPVHVRRRATLERGMSASFFDGHRVGNYVLCVDLEWNDPQPASGEVDDASRKQTETKTEQDTSSRRSFDQKNGSATCGVEPIDTGFGEVPASDRLEIVSWKDNDVLKDFERRFYQAGGVVNGKGF